MAPAERHLWAARHRAHWARISEHIDELEARLHQIAEAKGTPERRLKAKEEAWAHFDSLLAEMLAGMQASMLSDVAQAKSLEPICTEEELAQRRLAAQIAESELIGLDALQALELYRFKATTLPWAQRLEYDRLVEGVIRRGNPGLLSSFEKAKFAAMTPAEVRYEAARTEVIGIQQANNAVQALVETKIQKLRAGASAKDDRVGGAETGAPGILAVFDRYFGV